MMEVSREEDFLLRSLENMFELTNYEHRLLLGKCLEDSTTEKYSHVHFNSMSTAPPELLSPKKPALN